MWYEPIDIYCERLDATFWAEPLNAITSLSFIVVAFLALRVHVTSGQKHPAYFLMIVLLICVGIGSFLFHTVANSWSMLANTISMLTFMLFYVMFSIRYIFNKSWSKTAVIMMLVLIGSFFSLSLAQPEGNGDRVILNSSLQYAPILFFLGVFTFALYLRRAKLLSYGFYALVLFIVSLTFQTMDMKFCSSIAIGTHFIWHLLNAIIVYLLLYILNQAMKYPYRIEEE